MKTPTQSQIEALHHKHAPNQAAFDLIYGHCQIIWAIAEQLIDHGSLKVDRSLVKAACLLHDIGVYQVPGLTDAPNSQYIRHGILGHAILAKEGFDAGFCRFADHHTGAGISKQQILDRGLNLPPKDYFAETPEERLLMYADKFHSKRPCFNSYTWYRDHVGQFGPEVLARLDALRNEFGEPDLVPLSRKYHQPIR